MWSALHVHVKQYRTLLAEFSLLVTDMLLQTRRATSIAHMGAFAFLYFFCTVQCVRQGTWGILHDVPLFQATHMHIVCFVGITHLWCIMCDVLHCICIMDAHCCLVARCTRQEHTRECCCCVCIWQVCDQSNTHNA